MIHEDTVFSKFDFSISMFPNAPSSDQEVEYESLEVEKLDSIYKVTLKNGRITYDPSYWKNPNYILELKTCDVDRGFIIRERTVTSDDPTNTSNIISNPALQVYADNGSLHVANAQPNMKIQVFDMNGKTVASGATDAEGSAEIKLAVLKGVYVVSDGNQSTKVVVE